MDYPTARRGSAIPQNIGIYIYIYDSRDGLTFIGAVLLYANPVWDRRPRNRSDIPMAGYSQVSVQTQAYAD